MKTEGQKIVHKLASVLCEFWAPESSGGSSNSAYRLLAQSAHCSLQAEVLTHRLLALSVGLQLVFGHWRLLDDGLNHTI